MRSYYQNFCRLLFCAALCLGMPFICLCQNTAGWTLDAPANSVTLISVTQGMALGSLKFTFENVSGKTIVVLVVGDLHGSQVGIDGFVGGVAAVASGATTSLGFSSQDFSVGGQITKELRVDAIFYGDGSGYGFGPWKANVEDEMLGEALETKRDAGLLSASPDPSISGFDSVVAQIHSQPLSTSAEAAQSLRGVTLPGIPQALISEHLASQSVSIEIGAHRARGLIPSEIADVKSNDARWMAGSEAAQQLALERRPHALSDLAQKVSSWSEWQVQYLEKVFQEGNQ
ncbi:MAG: hypothetical protein ACRD2P_00750 [Terriglobia bacterium]